MDIRDKKKNIVLIGMPASGKSTIGVILAKELKYNFLDTDLLIQGETDQTLVEIIEERGLDGFLALEDEMIAGVNAKRCIIATGGSAVFGENAMAHLKENSVIVYLSHRLEVIESRLYNITTRGIAMKPGQTLKDIFDQRQPLYEKYADITIQADGLNTEQTVQLVIKSLENH